MVSNTLSKVVIPNRFSGEEPAFRALSEQQVPHA